MYAKADFSPILKRKPTEKVGALWLMILTLEQSPPNPKHKQWQRLSTLALLCDGFS